MDRIFTPIYTLAPHVESLNASAVRDTGRHFEWSYYHPDDCTIDGRHIRVRFAALGNDHTTIEVFKRSRPVVDSESFFVRAASVDDVVRSVGRRRDFDFGHPKHLYGTPGDRDAARYLLEAGSRHPGVFRDAWTMPTADPDSLFCIRTPRHQAELDDNQFIVTDSNGPVTVGPVVEAGAARTSGTHRVGKLATTLDEAIALVREGVVQPQLETEGCGYAKWMPMMSRPSPAR